MSARVSAHAMGFYHEKGFVPAWKQAMKFAGKGGRLATLPDIIAARLETKPGETPWETYYTTLSAEYYGFSKTSGRRILIVAHGIGPMATLDGILNTYGWHFKDKSRTRRGGRITEQQFWDLEAGKFGEVAIVDFEEYCQRYRYPFLSHLRFSELMTDPLVRARLGPETERYLRAHCAHARVWHREQAGIDPENRYNLPTHEEFCDRRRLMHIHQGMDDSDPYLLAINGASNCTYQVYRPNHEPIDKGYAIAHLLSTGRLAHVHHDRYESLALDIGCHEWWNGVRLVAIKTGGNVRSGIQAGPSAYDLLRKHWRELLIPMQTPETVRFRALVKIGDQWFTQYPKQGDGMDTWEPEYVVTWLDKVGEPVLFRTTVGGYHGFFKFGSKEVEAIAPPTANSYSFVGEPQIEWHDGNPTHHTAMVQFYRAAIDSSKRMVRSEQLIHDYEKMMELLQKESL